MANKFTNFLKGFLNGGGNLKDYQHAARLYVDDYYKLAPKAGWLYYVVLNINPFILDTPVINPSWRERFGKNIGVLAKSVDFPSVVINVQTINQYNRKTNVQTGITYQPIRVVFHNDMNNATTELWRSYYNYYYADGRYGQVGGGFAPIQDLTFPREFLDNKLLPTDDVINSIPRYGLNNGQNIPFFDTIKIYTLNRQQYSSVTLVNPLITQWSQSGLAQDSSDLLDSTMTIAYETVFYDTAKTPITNDNPGFNSVYYDNSPSPLSLAGGGTTSLLGAGGLLAGAKEVFGELGEINQNTSPLSLLNTALKTRNLARNASNLTKEGLKEEGLNILGNVIKDLPKKGNIPNPTKQPDNNLGAGSVDYFTGPNSPEQTTTPAKPVTLSA
jgi:hypothetical protein